MENFDLDLELRMRSPLKLMAKDKHDYLNWHSTNPE